MPRGKKAGVKSASELFREMIQTHPNISAKDALDRMRKEHGRTLHKQTFYTAKSQWKRKQLAEAGLPQKRRKTRKYQRRPIQQITHDDSQFEIRILRLENRKLKDMLMRSILED